MYLRTRRGGERGYGSGGCRSKNKNRTQFCGELASGPHRTLILLAFPHCQLPLACFVLQLAFLRHSCGRRTLSHGPNTLALKDGTSPEPAAHSAKRCFLNPHLAFLAFVRHSCGRRTLSQGGKGVA